MDIIDAATTQLTHLPTLQLWGRLPSMKENNRSRGVLNLVRHVAACSAATVFLLIALTACNKRVTESVDNTIRQLDNERVQAQIQADAAALDRLYAVDFIGVGPSGRVRTKPQVIADFTSGDLKFQSIKGRLWRPADQR